MRNCFEKGSNKWQQEEGSVLVIALILLVLLTVIGISASTTSEIELQIAGNERFHKMAFYAADGGTEAGIELLEQNIEARGFTANPVFLGSAPAGDGGLDFYRNLDTGNTTPDATNYDIHMPDVASGNVYLRIYGNTQLSTGSALQIAAGYEGKGKALGGGGAFMVYDIKSFAAGPANSQSRVLLRWRHLI
ncbi:PilX N-terminal domain-containing pilus assembly protein [Thermodesulfobacteriota bacterium]